MTFTQRNKPRVWTNRDDNPLVWFVYVPGNRQRNGYFAATDTWTEAMETVRDRLALDQAPIRPPVRPAFLPPLAPLPPVLPPCPADRTLEDVRQFLDEVEMGLL